MEWASGRIAGLGGSPSEVWRNPHGYDLFLYPDEAAIRALEPDLRGLAKLGNNLFVATAPGDATDVVSRVFVPGGGVDEDPVTGSAHCELAPYWAGRLDKTSFAAYQSSPRGGHLRCEVSGDRVLLSGRAVTFLVGEIKIEG